MKSDLIYERINVYELKNLRNLRAGSKFNLQFPTFFLAAISARATVLVHVYSQAPLTLH